MGSQWNLPFCVYLANEHQLIIPRRRLWSTQWNLPFPLPNEFSRFNALHEINPLVTCKFLYEWIIFVLHGLQGLRQNIYHSQSSTKHYIKLFSFRKLHMFFSSLYAKLDFEGKIKSRLCSKLTKCSFRKKICFFRPCRPNQALRTVS